MGARRVNPDESRFIIQQRLGVALKKNSYIYTRRTYLVLHHIKYFTTKVALKQYLYEKNSLGEAISIREELTW